MNRKQKRPSILLLYTGGTIGMIRHPETGSLIPFDFSNIKKIFPELNRIPAEISVHSFENPVDSSDIRPDHWVQIVSIIKEFYNQYDGFVILHGTDTMSYTASALSFLLENLNKPVILTGSQLPIGTLRTDGKENLITAIEIASARDKNRQSLIQEVCIYFEYKLFRGNRTIKYHSEHFNAFTSPNYPLLAEAGIEIKFNHQYLLPVRKKKPVFHTSLENDIMILHLFPGFSRKITESILLIVGLKALVLLTYGTGNAPLLPWFDDFLLKLKQKKILVVNVTQCKRGSVDQTRYETGRHLESCGVLSAGDMTLEATVTKLMFLFGQPLSYQEIKRKFTQNLCGERSV